MGIGLNHNASFFAEQYRPPHCVRTIMDNRGARYRAQFVSKSTLLDRLRAAYRQEDVVYHTDSVVFALGTVGVEP